MNKQAVYMAGFTQECIRRGVDPAAMIKHAGIMQSIMNMISGSAPAMAGRMAMDSARALPGTLRKAGRRIKRRTAVGLHNAGENASAVGAAAGRAGTAAGKGLLIAGVPFGVGAGTAGLGNMD